MLRKLYKYIEPSLQIYQMVEKGAYYYIELHKPPFLGRNKHAWLAAGRHWNNYKHQGKKEKKRNIYMYIYSCWLVACLGSEKK